MCRNSNDASGVYIDCWCCFYLPEEQKGEDRWGDGGKKKMLRPAYTPLPFLSLVSSSPLRHYGWVSFSCLLCPFLTFSLLSLACSFFIKSSKEKSGLQNSQKGIRRPKHIPRSQYPSASMCSAPMSSANLRPIVNIHAFLFSLFLRSRICSYIIPWEVLRIDPRARQIGQTALSQVQLEEIAHERLHGVFGFVLDLVDPALKALEVIAVVMIRI